MKISGFTFVRNALVFGYPAMESINSLLPLCDELVIAAGMSDDDTVEFLRSIDNPKIKIIETVWDEQLRVDGLIYSQQTNIALNECTGDWCIYLQADEVIHEKDYGLLLKEIKTADKNSEIESLLFRYFHFYGSYDYIGTGRQWYRREVRAFRNTGNVVSYGDAQGFRVKNETGFRKIKAKQTEVGIYHYGWVRQPHVQTRKILCAQTYYHESAEFDMNEDSIPEFDYSSAYELERFKGSHPLVMSDKISNDSHWTRKFNPSLVRQKPFVMKLSDSVEKLTGWRAGEYKDFVEVW
jgi:glycosyltransferase involved in cell wall biosynthesis